MQQCLLAYVTIHPVRTLQHGISREDANPQHNTGVWDKINVAFFLLKYGATFSLLFFKNYFPHKMRSFPHI